MRIALTQGEGRLERLGEELAARGHEVVRAPLVRTTPCLDGATRTAAEALTDCPWALFTSRSAVEAWTRLGLPLSDGPRTPALGAVGPGTAAALERAGGHVLLTGDPPDGAGLARTFLSHPGARGPVALPGGDRARPTLRRALQEAGLEVRPCVVYRTELLPWRVSEGVDAVVLASPSAAHALPAEVAGAAALVALGGTTATTLRRAGHAPAVAARPDADAVLEAVRSLARSAGSASRGQVPSVPPLDRSS